MSISFPHAAKFFKLGLFLLLLASSGFAQEQDMNLWTRLGAKYDVSKKTRLAFEQELRFSENISTCEEVHSEVGVTHELYKRLEGGLYYRFIYEPDPSRFYSIGHRGWLHLEYRIIDQDIRVSFRDRIQCTYQDIYSSKNGKIPEWYNRYKVGMEYQPKKATWVPSASAEFWQLLQPGTVNGLDKMRISAGLEYRQDKKLRWEIFYSFQQEIQVKNPQTDHIVGVTLTYMVN